MMSNENLQGDLLIVDDTPANLRFLSNMLSEQGYKVRPVTNGAMAIRVAESANPDLILLDINMPDMNGFEVCKSLKASEITREIPVIFISALDDTSDKVEALSIGGVDYITKPFHFEEVLVRVRTHISIRDLQRKLEISNQKLEDQVEQLNKSETDLRIAKDELEVLNHDLESRVVERTRDLALAYKNTLQGWAKALELRDYETKGHCTRVTTSTVRLARLMNISNGELVHIQRGAMLHDIGKMGISDQILLKPGPLNDEEWAMMKMHPDYARELLINIDYLQPAVDIPYCHHEKWDGSGYPRGLKGNEIPLCARIFAVVDVWDALVSDRPYRKAWPRQKVLDHISGQSGSHFDPTVIEMVLENHEYIFEG